MSTLKGIGGMRSIYHDANYYAQTVEAFTELSSRLSVLKSWVETVFPIEVVNKLPTLATGTSLRILGVGTGPGEIDRDLLAQHQIRYPDISNVVNEPIPVYVKEYKQALLDQPIPDVTFDYRVQTFEEYHEDWTSEAGRPRFHFISAISVLYYVDDVEKSIMDMHEMLEDGGRMMIIVSTDDSGEGRLWSKFSRLMFADTMLKYVTTGRVRDVLTRNGVKHDVVRVPYKRVDISCCFEKGNEQGKFVTDFLSHVIDLENSAPKKLVEEFFDYIGGPECSIKEDGKILFDNSVDAVIARK